MLIEAPKQTKKRTEGGGVNNFLIEKIGLD